MPWTSAALIVTALLVASMWPGGSFSSSDLAGAAKVSTSPPTRLPSNCTPTTGLVHSVEDHPTARIATDGLAPIKDLGIQPALLTSSQWRSLLRLARRAGVGVVNVGVGWSGLEPDGPHLSGSVLAKLDSFVSDARRDHLAVRFQLTGFPQWARAAGDPSESAQPWYAPTQRAELERWATWVKSVVRHFGTKVSFYEIWNEENISQFWPQGPNPRQYAALLACSYDAAKAANAGVTIVSGGLSTNDVGFLQALYRYLDRYHDAAPLNDFFDLLGVHPYSGGRPPALVSSRWDTQGMWGLDDANFLGFTRLHDVMSQHHQGSKQIYIGEYGAPVSGSVPVSINGFATVPAATQAKWVTLAYRLSARYRYVAALSWFAFYPDAYDPPAWAIVRNGGATSTHTAPTTRWTPTGSFRALAKVPSEPLIRR
ncbi:MAG TPA: hypothetical protein VGL60_02750 [Acidimicrobiales bacterium]|jgi:hypothetical protein